MRLTFYVGLLCVVLSVLHAGCGSQSTAEKQAATPAITTAGQTTAATQSAAAGKANSPAASTPAGTKGAVPVDKHIEAVDDEVRTPATVVEAARVLDLQSFPLLPVVEKEIRRTVASLSYQAPGDVKGVYEFQRAALVERKWKESPDPQVTSEYASGQFSRDGFYVSVSVFPAGDKGQLSIYIQNLSNVNLRKLPVPPGAKLSHAFPAIAAFVTDAGVDQTAAAVRKLLLDQGWQPYGSAGDSLHFKQNAVQLNARVFAPPAQPGKTSIDYHATQLSADLPAPADADSVQYSDQLTQLNLDVPQTPAELAIYYQAALAPAGWKSTSEKGIQDRTEYTLIFRNPAKDMLTLSMRDLTPEKKTRATLKLQSAAEVDELERQYQAAIEARKKKEEAERNKPKPKAIVTLPAGASEVSAKATEIEFKLATGKAKAAIDAIAKELVAAGWKVEEPIGEAAAGRLGFDKDNHTITIHYIDPGFIPAEITISASGVELERGTK
jgi:hypothetical protein